MACYRYIVLYGNPLHRLRFENAFGVSFELTFKSRRSAQSVARLLLEEYWKREIEDSDFHIRKIVSFDDGFCEDMFR